MIVTPKVQNIIQEMDTKRLEIICTIPRFLTSRHGRLSHELDELFTQYQRLE
jgi:hypothetical protein